MSTATMTMSNAQIQRSPRHTATIYLKEAKYEFLKNLRLRMYTASVLSFPIMFYVLFGLVLNSKEAIGGTTVPKYLIATYGTFGVMGASLFGTAAGLASDRGLGWLQVKRASPMPPFAYFAAKVVTSMIFSTIIVLALFALGIAFGRRAHAARRFRRTAGHSGRRVHCRSQPWAWRSDTSPGRTRRLRPSTLFICLCRSAADCGCRSCSCRKSCGRSRWRCLRIILSQLALGIVGGGSHESMATHWEVLVAFTMICLGVARIGFQRDQDKMYG